MKKTILAVFLAFLMTVSPVGRIESKAAEMEAPESMEETAEESIEENIEEGLPILPFAETQLSDIYVEQQGKGTCTLASAVMMMRARMYLSGNHFWPLITEESARPAVWLEGIGLQHGWTYSLEGNSMTVSYAETCGMTAEALKEMLDAHPEGIEVYDRGDEAHAPHAVYLTDYDGDTFYCADPAPSCSGRRMPLAESLIGARYDGTQETVLNTIDACWYISAYSIEQIGDPGSPVKFFVDVQETLPDYQAIVWAVENGIADGADVLHFAPQENATRAQAALYLWRAAGSPDPVHKNHSFVDLSAKEEYYRAVLWAVENKIMTGVDEVHFAPKESVTRAQLLTSLWREDRNTISFAPDAAISRADFVTFLYRKNCNENADAVY